MQSFKKYILPDLSLQVASVKEVKLADDPFEDQRIGARATETFQAKCEFVT